MISLYQVVQLGFALFVSLVIVERVRALCLRAATSDEALRTIVRAAESDEHEILRGFARARPEAQSSRLIEARLSDDPGAVAEVQVDLHEETFARLKLLRVCATLASTMGLLGGILTLAGKAEAPGLLALQAGAAERLRLSEAIATMAIGVATSALCFQALASLRPPAQKLLMQASQLARALAAK